MIHTIYITIAKADRRHLEKALQVIQPYYLSDLLKSRKFHSYLFIFFQTFIRRFDMGIAALPEECFSTKIYVQTVVTHASRAMDIVT